jgi:hypothetical protein
LNTNWFFNIVPDIVAVFFDVEAQLSIAMQQKLANSILQNSDFMRRPLFEKCANAVPVSIADACLFYKKKCLGAFYPLC